MPLQGSEVRVAGAGHVWAAPAGTVLPTDLAAPDPAFVDMGYVTTDGVGFTFSRESDDLDAWQGDKVRVLSSREPMSLTFSLMQTNGDVLLLALGGGNFATSGGVTTFTPKQGANAERALIIDFDDQGVKYRYIIPKAQIEGDVSFTLTRTDALTYPLTFGVLANTPKYQIISDDPKFAAHTLPESGAPPAGSPATIQALLGTAADPTANPPTGDNLIADTSIYVGSDDSIWVKKAGTWVDSTQALAATPGQVLPTIPTAPPAGDPAGSWSQNDVIFVETGGKYDAYVRGATATYTKATGTAGAGISKS